MVDTATRTPAITAQQRQAKARNDWLRSYRSGKPLSGAKLAAKYGLKEGWGQLRIREARKMIAEGSSPVTVRLPDDAEARSLPPATTPPSLPETRTPYAEIAEPSAPIAEPATADVDPQASLRPVRVWPVWLLMAPAAVAIWGGWVGLGELAGFGPVRLLPGIADQVVINTAITLPIGMEVYAAYALYVWLSGKARGKARRMARTSAIAALIVGAAGQIAYHVMAAAGVGVAPWWITAGVACLPVAVLGMGAALAHMVRADE